MPIPLGLLAAGVASGGLGVAQGVAGSKKSDYDKSIEERRDKLLGLQAAGKLGLSPQERQLREQQLLDPVRAAAEQAQSRADRVAAATGTTSGADLSRLRTESARQVGAGAQQAAQMISAEDLAKKSAQRAELSQLEATAEQRRMDRQASLFGGLSQAAGAAGAIAGALPETFRMAGLAGAPIRDPEAFDQAISQIPGISAESVALLQGMDKRQALTYLRQAANGQNLGNPMVLALRGQLRESVGLAPEEG